MFGMGFFEIVVIVIVGIIFLGPDKLPQAIVDVAKFFKVVKRTIHDAKQTIDSELNLSTLQQEAISYHQYFTSQVDNITKDMQLQEIDEIFSKYKALPPAKDSEKDSLESNALDSSLAQESHKDSKAPSSSKPKSRAKTTKKTSTPNKKTKKSAKQASKTPSKLDSTAPTSKGRAKSTKSIANKV